MARRWLCLGLLTGGLWLPSRLSLAQAPAEPDYLRPSTPCPQQLSQLVTGLVRDLPSYANRVASRSLERQNDFGSVLLAGQPDVEPLDLAEFTQGPLSPVAAELQQVFFTTLERQYLRDRIVELQHYHWLFLTRAESGWYLAFMFSSLQAHDSQGRPPTPPQDSSDGIIAQAVKLWLRDCRAEAVYPVESEVDPVTAETSP
ncbi:hypothetical protein XM38_009160 [Halomicronema hongdechloris C2206]|uniref:Uncharacterized protein n=1 Tax=Halomicronema hongdechloris C2206 TaxID=1641165 RepID=A0A1Z3HI67_9CYAN|nr:hypothetical protein [Halomicronema hongdechloris]ASC69986.1 hypothetical protein XM38_009160 [Halomicronema hongdechloris C2206]